MEKEALLTNKMHTYILARGIKKDLDRWVEDMSLKFVPFIYDGKQAMLQLSMRPIVLYEVAYPEPAHDTVMRILQPNDDKTDSGYYKKYNRFFFWLRKILRLDKTKVPDGIVIDQSQSFSRVNLGVHLIGSKKDKKEEIRIPQNEKI